MRGVGERGQRDPGAEPGNGSLSASTWNLHTAVRAGETLHTKPLRAGETLHTLSTEG